MESRAGRITEGQRKSASCISTVIRHERKLRESCFLHELVRYVTEQKS